MRKLISALIQPMPIKVSPIVHWHSRVGPISGSFHPPSLPAHLTFNLAALSVSVARTETLRRMSSGMLSFWGIKTFIEAMLLIENRSVFTLSSDFRLLADAKRTSFAGNVGAGIADLIMNEMR